MRTRRRLWRPSDAASGCAGFAGGLLSRSYAESGLRAMASGNGQPATPRTQVVVSDVVMRRLAAGLNGPAELDLHRKRLDGAAQPTAERAVGQA